MRISVLALVVLAATVVAPSAASAEAPFVVASFHSGGKPDSGRLVAPVIEELRKRNHDTGPRLARRIRGLVSKESGSLTNNEAVAAQRAVDQSYALFIDGEYATALTKSREALALYASAPGLLTQQPSFREQQFKAYLIASRSEEVLGHGEGAFRTMAEAIRTFPDRHVSAAEFDPRVNALFRRVRKELEARGVGSLDIDVSDPAGVVFVNESYAGTGKARVDGLFAGTYRVYVTDGSRGRVRDVRVDARQAASLSVDWHLDRALRSTAETVQLEFPSGTSIQDELVVMTALARTLDAEAAVLVGVREVEGRRAVVGYKVERDSQSRVFAAVQVEPMEPAPSTLANLAALLAGDKDVDTTDLMVAMPELAPRHEEPSDRWYSDRWGWAIAGGGALATGAGLALLVDAASMQDDADVESRQAERRSLRDRADARLWLGSGLAAAGLGAVAVGVVKLVATAGERAATIEWTSGRIRVRPAAGIGWLGVSGAF